ncbi:MAG: hypothetical protein V3V55_09380 [Rhodospirillales bacterium]
MAGNNDCLDDQAISVSAIHVFSSLIRTILEALGVESLEEARDGSEAIEVLKSFEADLAIIEHPRPFIRTGIYFGPDRRRQDSPSYRGGRSGAKRTSPRKVARIFFPKTRWKPFSTAKGRYKIRLAVSHRCLL